MQQSQPDKTLKNKLLKIRNVAGILDNLEQDFPRRGEAPKIPLNSLPELSRKIWGLQERQLIVIGARTSNGKSSLALQIALDTIELNLPTWFVSLEMSEDDIVERMFCNKMEVDNWQLLTGQYTKNPQIKIKFASFKSFLKESKYLVTCGIGSTYKELITFYNMMQTKPKIILFDYIQAIKTSTGNSLDEITEFVGKLRELAVSTNAIVICVSQINRDAKNTEPESYQLKGCGFLEEHADKVILLHWPWLTDNAKNKNEYVIKVSKNRNGRTGILPCWYIPEYYKIIDNHDAINNYRAMSLPLN